MQPIRTKPFLPSDLRRNGGTPLVRAAAAYLIARRERTVPLEVVKAHWPHDRDAEVLTRAAVVPATITGSGWSSTLASTAVADFFVSMGPASAGAALLARGLQLEFDSAAAITVPGLLASAAYASFVQEASPIPVRELSLTGATLAPRKFATITTFTREIFERSTPTIEAVVRTVLTESVALALDTALLDATAGDSTRPAGLRFGISAAGAASNNPVQLEAMKDDIATIAAGVIAVAGNYPIIIIAAPPQALALRLWAGRDFPQFDVLASSGLANGTVMAIASNAVASAIDPAPTISVSTEATLHMDTTPLALASVGTPNTVAAPMRSLYQTDSLGLRLVLNVAWALRNAGGLAWLSGTTW
jgi:Phage capsid family